MMTSNAGVRVSNLTNSTAPEAINSRVFVGNLNTFVVAKEDIERLFKRYGRIVAISMHKGYAFVQYSNTIEARNSVIGEDGRMIANQILDVNMVSEPKPHQTGRKRQCLLTAAAAAATTDWDLYYEGYSIPRIVPPIKRSRIDFLTAFRLQRPKYKSVRTTKQPQPAGKTTPVPVCQDILICGTCKESFADLQKIVEHKKTPCQLQLCCKCQDAASSNNNDTSSEKSMEHITFYTCYVCKEKLPSALEIIEHAHNCHDIKIVDVQEMLNEKYDDCDQPLSDFEEAAKNNSINDVSMTNGVQTSTTSSTICPQTNGDMGNDENISYDEAEKTSTIISQEIYDESLDERSTKTDQ